MSLFARSLNRFTGTPSDGGVPPNEQNITYRKKISAVSTSLGGDGPVAESPRNLYTRQNVVLPRRKVFDETDGAMMSTTGRTPVELKAAEIRLKNIKNEVLLKKEENHAPPPVPIESASSSNAAKSTQNQKKSRTSTSSLASVFRSRASSPIERMRKFIGRSSSKQPKEISAQPLPSVSNNQKTELNDQFLIQELDKIRNQLAETQCQLAERNKEEHIVQMVTCSQQCDPILGKNVSTMTDQKEFCIEEIKKKTTSNKENTYPDIICIDDNHHDSQEIQRLKLEVARLQKENSDQKEDFRRTRKDFILILKEAVLRKDEAERKLESVSKSISDEDDWVSLMSQHRHALRRNVLLMWVQKKLEPYSDQLNVSNFSSDWTDCRAFCALLNELFPETILDVSVSPIVGDCVSRCRRTFQLLKIPFDERALGITTSPIDSGADDSSSASSVITGLTDWRYIMNTVFALYKRGVLGK
uniref:Calponin-homology (CH) domain-containing protein n=1 Tax=Caenorhabditis tropicalis TaxID=1561998 RepID=A0A1I7TEK2_9PELO